jgi:hypothetical protein
MSRVGARSSVLRHPLSVLRHPLFAVAILLAAGAAWAADPQIGRIEPAGAQRGTQLDLLVRGARLGDAQQLMFYDAGIRAGRVEPQKDGTAKARLAIAPDCRLGLHALRLRTASGISNLVTFSVGALAEIAEIEPNNDFDKPQKIPLNVTVNGVVENEDVDYYQVEAKKGQRIVAEIEGFRLGETTFDPCVTIYDRRRFVLAQADDTPLLWQDGVAAIIAPADGPYIIQVRESAFGGNGLCRYRLHVGTFPRPLAVYPAGGPPGTAVQVRWLGDVGGPWSEKILLPAAAPPSLGLFARTEQGIAPSSNPFRLGRLVNVMEVEPNDTPAQATPASAPAALNGVIGAPGDVDCFKFPAKAGQVFDVRVHARSIRSPLDPVLQVARCGGQVLAANDDSGTPDSYLRFQAPADDQYVITVRDHLGQGGPHYVYRVEITPVEPRVTLGLVERQQFVDIVMPVPQGNRVACMLNAQREDFEGELALALAGLPPGITAEVLPLPADQSQVPLVLTAAPDAPLAGALVDVVARHPAKERRVEGRLDQRSMLVRGQNNVEVRSYHADRMAVAVTRPAPFRLRIVEPKVPLVENGLMELKVEATREAGFRAPITVQMLYQPPGVSAPASVVIPEGRGDALVPLTADASAKTGPWKIAVTGEATVGDGPVLVSSPLSNLTVADPYFKLTFPPVATDKGQATDLAVKVQRQKDFDGKAAATLLGLPNEVTSQAREFTKDATEVVFPLKTTARSPVGVHRSLLCRIVVTSQGEPITHLLGTGELRVQEPIAKKASPAASPPVQSRPSPAAAAAKAPEKRLSRLEQLRLERQQASGK